MDSFERFLGISDSEEKASKIQRRTVRFLMIFCCTIPVLLPIIGDYTQKQYLLRRTTESIMFVSSSVIVAAAFAAFIQIICIIVYGMKFMNIKFLFQKNWKGLSSISLLIMLLTLFPFLFINERFELRNDGIYKISLAGSLAETYPWDKVSEGQVYIDYSVKYGYQFYYDIVLENEKRLELYPGGYSKDIWDSLRKIDYLLWENDVYIDRDRQYIEELEGEENDKGQEFLIEIDI